MKIVVWSDFQCPFCYMGEKKMEKAIDSVPLTEPVEIIYKAYQLDPDAPAIPRETMTEHFMSDHDITLAQAERRMKKISDMASEIGLHYNLAGVKVCSSLDAHRLMKYAVGRLSPGKLKQLNFSVFKANFEENLLISDRNVLADLAEVAGLDREDVSRMLAGEEYKAEVMEDQREIDSRSDFEFVPFILFPGDHVMQGVVSEEALISAVKSAMDGANPSATVESGEMGCGPGGCAV